MQSNTTLKIEIGQPIQIRAMRHTFGPAPAIAGRIESQEGMVVAVSVAEPVAPGTPVGIETPDALLLAEAVNSCRWGPGIQVSFTISQVIPLRSDLHNLVAAVNRHGARQTHGAPSKLGRI